MTKTLNILILIFLIPLSVVAQVGDGTDEENFVYQVKQIDEFLDRFNNADYTPIKSYLQEKYNVENVSTEELILSLFDQENDKWDSDQIQEFLKQIVGKHEPPYLDFYDNDWYAELDCSGTYRNKPVKFKLILKIEVVPVSQASKWVVVGGQAKFLELPESKDGMKSINPASYGTDFMGLVDILSDTANFKNYLSQYVRHSHLMTIFNELYKRDLKLSQIDDLTYHFLQIENWGFTVKDFVRESKNSGWLICDLKKLDNEQKVLYKNSILFLETDE